MKVRTTKFVSFMQLDRSDEWLQHAQAADRMAGTHVPETRREQRVESAPASTTCSPFAALNKIETRSSKRQEADGRAPLQAE
jgi:hypothetical protein